MLKDGSLLGWGGGGVIGAGDFDQHLTPVPVCGDKGVSAVFSGGEAREGNEPGETTAFAIGAPGPLCPVFASTKPAWGTAGTTLTLKGINLEDVSSVLVGGSPASLTFVSPKEIHAQVPPGSGDVSITGVGPAGSFDSQSGGLFDYIEAPSFGACVRTLGVEIPEEFSNNQCTTRGSGGGYEWEPLYEGGLASVSKKSVVLETAGVKVTCTTETGKGALTSNKTAGSLVWTLTGCERLTQPCSSSGAPSGTIVTEALQGSIAVYKPGAKGDKVKDKAGLVISPATDGPVAQFSCGGTSIVVSGSVIGMLPTNKENPRLALKFAVKKGGQEPSGVPGGPSHLLSASVGGGAPQATTITGTIDLTINNGAGYGVEPLSNADLALLKPREEDRDGQGAIDNRRSQNCHPGALHERATRRCSVVPASRWDRGAGFVSQTVKVLLALAADVPTPISLNTTFLRLRLSSATLSRTPISLGTVPGPSWLASWAAEAGRVAFVDWGFGAGVTGVF